MAHSTIGIKSFGAYIPSIRLDRSEIVGATGWINPALRAYSKGTRAVCDFDEDTITMSVEAARFCLRQSTNNNVSALIASSTTMPFADRLNTSVISGAVGLDENLEAYDVTGSQRAGLSALHLALSISSGGATSGDVLCLSADRRRGRPGSTIEVTSGDGAAAFLVGSDDVIARCLAHEVSTVDFIDHYRRSDQLYDYGGEERWIREEGYRKIAPPVIHKLLEEASIAADDINHFIFPCPIRGVTSGIARQLGVKADAVCDDFYSSCGDTGVAHPLMMLADTLCKAAPGEKILVVGFGQGCEVMLLETTPLIAEAQHFQKVGELINSPGYQIPLMRYLAFNEQIDMDYGPRAEADKKTSLSVAFRHSSALSRLVAGQCRVCGTIQFPKSTICVNPNCLHEGDQDDHPLVDETATIHTITSDWLGYSRNPPNRYGVVDFTSGARTMLNFTSSKDEPRVGDTVTLAFRIQEVDQMRKFHRYSWKAIATPTSENGADK